MKPQILHQFRAPSSRPPAAVAYIFTALAFAPLLVLMGLLASLGINLNVSASHDVHDSSLENNQHLAEH